MPNADDDKTYIGMLEQIIEVHLDLTKFYITNKKEYEFEIFAEHIALPFYYGLYSACKNSTKKMEYFGRMTDLGIKYHKASEKT